MSYTKKEFNLPSSDGIHTLKGWVYIPECEPKGIYHIVHGMTEHIGRYDKFMTDLAEQGYIAAGYDNLGHGYTASDASELGYIAKEKGYDYLARDVGEFEKALKNEYKNIPYYLMGHSMGSFITRLAVKEKYAKPDKFIIMGTGGSNPAAGAGIFLINVIKLFKGERHISKLVDSIAFGSYNDRFGGGKENDPSPWLTCDENVRKIYYADRFCTFKFTLSAMKDLIMLIKKTNCKEWYKNMPKALPILIVSGKDDPVGNYSKGVTEVESGLKAEGCNAAAILYDGARHEILNDFTYIDVKKDISDFLTK